MEEVLTAAICPTCGAPLEVLPDTGELKCKYCDVTSLDNRHTYSHVMRDFQGELEHQLENAASLLKSGLYDEAEDAYRKLLSEFSTDHRVWWGLLIAGTHNFTTLGIRSRDKELNEMELLYKSAVDRAPQETAEEYRYTYEKWIKSIEEYERRLAAEKAEAERRQRMAENRRKFLHNLKNFMFFAVFAVFIYLFIHQCDYLLEGGVFPELTGIDKSIDGILWIGIIAGAFSVLFGVAAIIARFRHAQVYDNLIMLGCTGALLYSEYKFEGDQLSGIADYIPTLVIGLILFALATMFGRIPAKIADNAR